MASDIRIKLLRLVLDNPEIKRDAIHAHKEFEDEEDRTLASLLYNCKKDEQLVADESLRYTITAKGRAYLKAAGVDPSAATKSRGRVEPVVHQPEPERRGGKIRPSAPEVRAAARTMDVPAEELQHSLDKTHYNAAARGIADKLMHQAQAALDEYVASVCDPEILNRFQAARDSARDLVSSFDGAGDGSEGGERG